MADLAEMKPPPNARKWDNSVMRLNVPDENIKRNIEINIRRGLPQVHTLMPQPVELAIVGGGWSLNDTESELRDLLFQGRVPGNIPVKVVALNGAGNWLVERNIYPSAHYIMDARESSVEFLAHKTPGCRYLIASQCDPAIFDALEGEDVHIFHVLSGSSDKGKDGKQKQEDDLKVLLDRYYNKRWQEIPGAGTIGIVSLPLSSVLGFSKFHLFGIDSCYPDGDRYHHAYPQPVNDGETVAKFWCAGREFRCSPWQASQANNFMEVTKALGEHLQIAIYGDGLLAHMVATGSQLSSETANGCTGI